MTYVSQDNPAGIKYMISDRINHFDDFHPEQIDAERGACEAPNVWKRIGQNKWVVMYDIYSIRPNNFGFLETSDFKTFTPLGHFNEGKMKLTNFVSPKHGSVIHITKAEAKRLEQYWSEKQKKSKTIRSGELWYDDGGELGQHATGRVFSTRHRCGRFVRLRPEQPLLRRYHGSFHHLTYCLISLNGRGHRPGGELLSGGK
jgi:hypothetical protein